MPQVRLTPARAIALSLVAFVCIATFTLSSRVTGAQHGPAAGCTASPGKAVYDKHCVECHGSTGKGDGPAAMMMVPHPRDFTSGRYKIRSTETGSVPTDDDLLRSVRQGTVRQRDARVGADPFRRRHPRRRAVHKDAVASIRRRAAATGYCLEPGCRHARERQPRRGGLRKAAVREMPRRQRPRRGCHSDIIRGRVGLPAARR